MPKTFLTTSRCLLLAGALALAALPAMAQGGNPAQPAATGTATPSPAEKPAASGKSTPEKPKSAAKPASGKSTAAHGKTVANKSTKTGTHKVSAKKKPAETPATAPAVTSDGGTGKKP